MKITLCLLFLVISANCVLADDIPPVAQPGEGAYIRGELIYPLDDRPTPQCHASTIEDTPSGLVAAWFGGKHEKAGDVGIWVSRHEDGGWSPPVEVADGVQRGRDYPCWNPVLFRPKDGPLILFYKVGPSPREWWGVLITSVDGGESWSEPRKLGKNEKLGQGNPNLVGPVKNKPIQLPDGSILCGSSTEHDGWRVHFEMMRQNRHGGRWDVSEVIGPINKSSGKFDAIQPTILKHGDGTFQALCRTRQEVIACTWSQDGGHNWSSLQPTELPNPNAGIDGVTLENGKHLLVYNHTTFGRGILNVATSKHGKEWKPVLTLEKQRGEYSYPAVIQTRDGLVHITYTFRRRSVKHVVLDPDRIR